MKRYERIEREHFGDHDKQTGIYAPKLGRPAKPAADVAKTRTIRLTDADFAKLKAIGMDRLRAWLRRTPSTK